MTKREFIEKSCRNDPTFGHDDRMLFTWKIYKQLRAAHPNLYWSPSHVRKVIKDIWP